MQRSVSRVRVRDRASHWKAGNIGPLVSILDGRVFDDAVRVGTLPDRISEAIEVLRISALSSYEDKRISTSALLFGTWPDACHSVPSQPANALPYSSELTSIRSFHRICDGLRTIALVDENGFMVELVDVQEWAQPYSALELPVPSARRYRTHSQATLCGGHICLVLTPNGEIKIFGEGVQLFNFFDGRRHLTDRSRNMKRGRPRSAAKIWRRGCFQPDSTSQNTAAAGCRGARRRSGCAPDCERIGSAGNRPARESRRQESAPFPIGKNTRYRPFTGCS